MKKLFTLSIIAIASLSIEAQVKKGSVFLGGDVGGSVQKTKTGSFTVNTQTGISVSPVFGKAIKDNLVFGVNASIGFFKNDQNNSTAVNKQNSYGGGIFLRKYKPLGSQGFYLFLQGNVNGNYIRNLQEEAGSYKRSIKGYSATLSAYPGISYKINKKLHLETGFNNLLYLNYFHEKREEGITTPVTVYRTSSFSIGSSLNNLSSLYVGFRLLIAK